MTISRAQIYTALWNLASATPGFATVNRRVRLPSEVAPAEQPHLCMAEKRQRGEVKALGAPTVWTLEADLIVYVQSSDPYVAPATLLDPLVDAIDAALAPPAPGSGGRPVQQLGLPQWVQHAYLAGEIITDEGQLGDQAFAVIPVEILCVG